MTSTKPKFSFKKKGSEKSRKEGLSILDQLSADTKLIDVHSDNDLSDSFDDDDFISVTKTSRRKCQTKSKIIDERDEEIEIDMVVDTRYEEIVLTEEISITSTTSGSSSSSNNNDSSRIKDKLQSQKELWSGIMSKMRVPKFNETKKNEAANAWGGLMQTMRKNQEKHSIVISKKNNGKKGKNSSSTAKRPNNNNNSNSKEQSVNSSKGLKRLKYGASPLKSKVLITLDDDDDENANNNDTTDNKSATTKNSFPSNNSDENTEYISIEEDEKAAECKKEENKNKNPVNICPIFLPKSAKTANNMDGKDSQSIKDQIMQMQSSGHPWNTENYKDAPPEKIEINQDGNGSGSNFEEEKKAPKNCPFYKKIPSTSFSVDAFDCGVIPGIDVYFLSHFHYDHYRGLTRKFAKTIVCSSPTGNLVKMKLGVADQCIRTLELNKIYIIQGVEVVLIDANHCPGSVMFILKLPNGTTYLHTGDFRYTTEMLENRFLSFSRLDCLYLDTTYCDPQYDFPTQTSSISQALTALKKHLAYRPNTLVVCGAYVIGKERVFFNIASALGTKVFCEPDKRRIINQLENSYFKSLLSDNESHCQVHVLKMNNLNPQALSEYLAKRNKQYSNVFAISPTGWEFSKGKSVIGLKLKSYLRDTVTIVGVPYSEHSSFSELRDFVVSLKPKRVQPTVNVGNPAKRTSMMGHIDGWLSRP